MRRYLALVLCLLLMANTFTSALAVFELPASLEVIDMQAFADTAVSGVQEVSGEVETVGAGAFSGTGVNALVLGEGVKNVGDNVAGGSDVVYVEVQGADTAVSGSAFAGVPYVIAENSAQAGGSTFVPAQDVIRVGGFCYLPTGSGEAELLFAEDPSAVSGSIEIPEVVGGLMVTGLSSHAFAYCDNVTSVTLPNTVLSVPDGEAWPEDAEIITDAPDLPPADSGAVEMTMPRGRVNLLVGGECYIDLPEDAPKGQWQVFSGNENVAAVSQDGRIRAVGSGASTVTIYIRAADALYYGIVRVMVIDDPTLSIQVYNADDGVIHLPVGQTSPIHIGVKDSNFDISDEELWELSTCVAGEGDGEIITVDELGMITALAAGEGSVIVTAALPGGEVLCELEVPVNVYVGATIPQRDIYVYGNEHHTIEAINLPEGAQVEWRTEDSSVFGIETAYDDEGNIIPGMIHINTRGVEGERQTDLVGKVTDAEGNQIDEVRTTIHVRPFELWINGDDSHEYTIFSGGRVTLEDMLGAYLVNNLWITDMNRVSFTWRVEDPEVLIEEDGLYRAADVEEPAYTGAVARVEYTDTEGNLCHEEERRFSICVRRADICAWLEHDYYELELGQDCGLHYWWDNELLVSKAWFEIDDKNIVTVSPDGAMTAVGAGETHIRFCVEDVAGNVSKYAAHVRVNGYTGGVTLTPENPVMNVGDIQMLSVAFETEDGARVIGYDIRSEDDHVVIMDGYYAIARNPGIARVCFDAHLENGCMIQGSTLVTVVDDENPLALSDTSVSLECFEAHQLTAEFKGKDVTDDCVWRCTNDGYARVENGLVTLLNCWDYEYVICEYTDEDGAAYEALCAVFALPRRGMLDGVPGCVSLAVGSEEYVSVNALGEGVNVEWTAADPEAAAIETMNNGATAIITGLRAGRTTVIVRLYDGEGVILDERQIVLYVDVPFEDPSASYFMKDEYFYPLEEGEWLPEWCLPEYQLETEYPDAWGLVRIESDNPELISMDEHGNWCYNYGTGEATITATVEGYPELTAQTRVIITRAGLNAGDFDGVVNIGDTISLKVEGIPEAWKDKVTYTWEYNTWQFTPVDDDGDPATLTLMAANGCHDTVGVEVRIHENLATRFYMEAETLDNEYSLARNVLRLNTGEGWGLETNFECDSSWTWASDNEAVAAVEGEEVDGRWDGIITAVGEGTARVTVSTTDDEGNYREAACVVIVEDEPRWDMLQVHGPDPIIMGTEAQIGIEVDANSEVWPAMTFSVDNEEIAQVDPDTLIIRPLKPGTFTFTAEGVKKDRDGNVIAEDTISREFTVAAAAVQMSDMYPQLTAGESRQLEVVNNTNKTIESIEWSSTYEDIAVVDETGLVTMVGDPMPDDMAVEIVITAKVTFADGSVACAMAFPGMVRTMELGNVYFADEIAMGENGMPGETEMTVEFSSTLSREEFKFWWESDNEQVASFWDYQLECLGEETNEETGEVRYSYASRAIVNGVNVGEATLCFRAVSRAGEMLSYFINVSVTSDFDRETLDVYLPEDHEQFDEQAITLPTRSLIMAPGEIDWIDVGDEINDQMRFYSGDENIARVDQQGRVIAAGEGETVITVVRRGYDGYTWYGLVDVTVVTPEFTHIIHNLDDEGKLYINAGSRSLMSFGYKSNVDFDDSAIMGLTGFASDNTDVLTIGEDSYLEAKAMGTANVTITTELNGIPYSTTVPVQVLDEICLDHEQAHVYAGDSLQLTVLNLSEGMTVTWYSENEEFAQVDAKGLVTVSEDAEGCCRILYDVSDENGLVFEAGSHFCDLNVKNLTPWIEGGDEEVLNAFMEGEFNFFENYGVEYGADKWWFDYENVEVTAKLESADPAILKVVDAEEGTVQACGYGETELTVTATATYTYMTGSERSVSANRVYRVCVGASDINAWTHENHIKLNVGDTAHIGYEYHSQLGVTRVRFASSDESVFTVSAEGRISAVGTGEAVYSVIVEDPTGATATAACTVSVNGSARVRLPETVEMEKGQMLTLVPSLELPEDDDRCLRDYEFRAEDESVIILNGRDAICAVGAGATVVNMRGWLNDGTEVQAMCTAVVKDTDAELFITTEDGRGFVEMRKGESVQLIAVGIDGLPLTGAWSTPDTDCITVSDDGLVTMIEDMDVRRTARVDFECQIDAEVYAGGSIFLRGLPVRAALRDVPEAIEIGEGMFHRINTAVSVNDPALEGKLSTVYSVVLPEDAGEDYDPAVAVANPENGTVVGVHQGVETVACELMDADGYVYDRVVCDVYVNLSMGEPAGIAFAADEWTVIMEENQDAFYDWQYNNVIVDAPYGLGYDRLRMASSDPGIVETDGDRLIWHGAEGTTTISAWLEGYPAIPAAEYTLNIRRGCITVGRESLPEGECFTAEVYGIYAGDDPAEYHWEYDEWGLRIIESGRREDGVFYATFAAAERDHESHVNLALRMEDGDWQNFGRSVWIYGSDLRFSERYVQLNPGESIDLTPEFPLDNEHFSPFTHNSDVADMEILYLEEEDRWVARVTAAENALEQDDPMTMVGAAFNDDPEYSYAALTVRVTEPGWSLVSIDVPQILEQGRYYGLDYWVDSSTYNWPETTWTSSDDSVIEIDMDQWHLYAAGEGTADVTVTCEKDGQTETLTKTIRVYCPAVAIEEMYPNVQPDVMYTARTAVRDDIADMVESVTWFTGTPAAVTLEPDSEDPLQCGYAVSADYISGNSDVQVNLFCRVVLNDGTAFDAACWPQAIMPWDCYFEPVDLQHEFTVSLSGYPCDDTETIHLAFDTNLVPDQYTVEVENTNEEILEMDEYTLEDDDGILRLYIPVTGLEVGEGEIIVRIRDNDLEHCDFEFVHGVLGRVIEPRFDIVSNEPEVIEIFAGDTRAIDCYYETYGTEGHGIFHPVVWHSSDPQVATVNPNGVLSAVGSGECEITLEVYSDAEYLIGSHTFNVKVIGPCAVSDAQVLLQVGEFTLIDFYGDSESFQPEKDENGSYMCNWSSDNEAVATVSSTGCVYAMAPGTATITCAFGGYILAADGEPTDEFRGCEISVPVVVTGGVFSVPEAESGNGDVRIISRQSKTVSCPLAEGVVPESVTWFSDDEDIAIVYSMDDGLTAEIQACQSDDAPMYTYVGCEAIVGGEAYTFSFRVAVVPPAIIIEGMDGMRGVGVGEEQFVQLEIRYGDGTKVANTVIASDDESIATVGFWEDNHMYIRGKAPGVTGVSCRVTTVDGDVYLAETQVYVETDFPEVEDIITVEQVVLARGTNRWLPVDVIADNEVMNERPVDMWLEFEEDADQSIISIEEHSTRIFHDKDSAGVTKLVLRADADFDGAADFTRNVEVVALGEMHVEPVTADENGNLVIDGEAGNIYRPGDQIQLALFCGDALWNSEYGNVYFVSHFPENEFTVTEDGLLTLIDPRSNAYELFAKIDGRSDDFDARYQFGVEGNTVDAYYAANNYGVVYCGQTGGLDMRVGEDIIGRIETETMSTSDAGVLSVNGDEITAVASGTARINRVAMDGQGVLVAECAANLTVADLAAPQIEIVCDNFLLGAYDAPIDIHVKNPSAFGINFSITSGDPDALKVWQADDGRWYMRPLKDGAESEITVVASFVDIDPAESHTVSVTKTIYSCIPEA